MNSAGKHAMLALLVIFIAGCAEKKAKTSPPAQAQAPALDTGKPGAMYPPPLTQPEAAPPPAPAPAPTVAKTEPTPPPQPPPADTGKATPKKKSKPSAAKPAGANSPAAAAGADTDKTAAPPAATTTPAPAEPSPDVAANREPAPASPIGQLSTGDAAGQTQTRKDTVDLITNTENGLNGIKRTLNAQEQETYNQIKTFLVKAKQALSNEDLDGAFTLATKAKVLLDELNKT